jgi:hypothetical protein
MQNQVLRENPARAGISAKGCVGGCKESDQERTIGILCNEDDSSPEYGCPCIKRNTKNYHSGFPGTPTYRGAAR